MTTRSAHARATFLLYAALQFVVLTLIAMRVYNGGSSARPRDYEFWNNFLSELGATRSWEGRPNTAAMLLFSLGLATIGVALVAFSRSWAAFAFARHRTRWVGLASEYLGALCGCGFVALAFSPVNRVLEFHNGLVVVAFALLLGYTVCLTVVWARNGATTHQLVACSAYVVIVIVYFAVVIHAVRLGLGTWRCHRLLVGSQKIMVYASMAYVVYLMWLIRRELAARD